jgi:hypothetical protein
MHLLKPALFLICFLLSSLATGKDYEDEFDTLWESLWSQGGSPQEIVRWPKGTVKYRYFGVNLNVHRSRLKKAIAAASEFSGLKFEDVSDALDSDKAAQLHIEIVPNSGDVTKSTPCYVRTNSQMNWELKRVSLRMRDDAAYKCSFHEMMHAIGVRGHPSGKTVLSYFRPRDDIFFALDQTMLRAWYSSDMRAGMTPFEAIHVLTNAFIQESPEDASQKMFARQKYLQKTLEEMRNFALGNGEPPRIVIRSGRISLALVEEGRSRIAWFLGLAYEHGNGVPKDLLEAQHWYTTSAQRGHKQSQQSLARMLESQAGGTSLTDRAMPTVKLD